MFVQPQGFGTKRGFMFNNRINEATLFHKEES